MQHSQSAPFELGGLHSRAHDSSRQISQPEIQQIRPQQILQPQQHSPPVSSSESVSSTKSINPQQLNTSVSTNTTTTTSNAPQQAKSDEINQSEWFRDLVFPPFDLNLPFSAHASTEDLKGFFGPTSLLADTNDNYRKQLTQPVPGQQQQQGQPQHQPSPQGQQQPPHFFLDDALLITAEIRDRIIAVSNIEDKDLPSLADLKRYIQLYEYGFNKYFPFIHLPSLRNPNNHNFETIPLLLAIAAIGALYAYSDNDPLILFNLSKFHIQNFFEKEITLNNLHFKKVPLMAHQCLVLHIFISLLLNEPNMMDITSRQIKSMIGLMKSTNFNQPLEKMIIPPPSAIPGNTGDKSLIQKNYDYFIMAQSRIRTLHVFYFLQTFRSSFGGVPILFSYNLLSSGNFCSNEKLWWCEGANSWYNLVLKTYPGKWSLVDVSNGIGMDTLIGYLKDSSNAVLPLSYNNLLSLLFTIHERLITEFNSLVPFSNLVWQDKKRKLADMINNWEVLFHQSYGSMKIFTNNRANLTSKHELKLILPIHLFIKMKLEVQVHSMSAVLHRDWDTMNKDLDTLRYRETRYNVLTRSLPYCRDMLSLWMYNIETINYDVRETARRTPAFFCCAIFTSAILVATYLDHLEKDCASRDITNQELDSWYECQELLANLETVLSVSIRSTYSDNLTKDITKMKPINPETVKKVVELGGQRELCDIAIHQTKKDIEANKTKLASINKQLSQLIIDSHISIKAIYLGIRILADVPVWPLAMVFAEALKNRATYVEKN
ncbi:TDA9 Probable transcription factor TDA9 [Candida maltosa Xu316]